MAGRRSVSAIGGCFVIAVGVALLWRDGSPAVPGVDAGQPGDAGGETARVAAPGRRDAPDPPPDAPDPFADACAAFARALAAGDGRDEAAALRRLLRTDAGAFAAATGALLAPETAPDLRRALAMVLGTLPLPGVDEALLAALAQFGADDSMVVTLVAALGALRDPPDEDDVFDLDAAPNFGVHGPGGIGITVRNVIRDPAVETALAGLLLERGRRDVRFAAASALQWSLDQDTSRTRFRTALAAETEDAVAAVLGEALGTWSRRKDGIEVGQIVGELLDAADHPAFAECRLRLETALQEVPLGEADVARLRGWTLPGTAFEQRAFAFTVLTARPDVDPATRADLIGVLRDDADPALRDHAARLLGGLPPGEDSISALRAVFDGGGDWSLRSRALGALAALMTGTPRAELLQRALADADSRIQRAARRLRGS